MINRLKKFFLVTAGVLGLASCAQMPTTPPELVVPQEAAPVAFACPAELPPGARCLRGIDSAKSPYWVALPAQWNNILVVHAHGGPFLGAPTEKRGEEDLQRWAIFVKSGYALVGSVFRQGGFEVTTAAQDTERVRQIYLQHFPKPKLTVLHGQSWGGMVATKAAELYPQSWQAILLTSAVVAGSSNYDFRTDLRAIYQHYCNNHPRPNEPQYPLNMGLPVDAKVNAADVASRASECLGTGPVAQRSPEQQKRLKNIASVLRIPETSVLSHLNWGTLTLADITRRHNGSPFHNTGVVYQGSDNDIELNQKIQRFAPNQQAISSFARDVEYQGRFAVPVISAHGIGDSTVFVEGQDILAKRMKQQGLEQRLVQSFVKSREHSYWGDAYYPALMTSLLAWVEQAKKPTAQSIFEVCRAQTGNEAVCGFDVGYQVQPFEKRFYPRKP